MSTLPGRPSLEHIKKQAKRLLKAARAEEPEALTQVGPLWGTPQRSRSSRHSLSSRGTTVSRAGHG